MVRSFVKGFALSGSRFAKNFQGTGAHTRPLKTLAGLGDVDLRNGGKSSGD